MSKNKKYLKKIKDRKFLEDDSEEISLEDQIREASEGLFYISETDAEIIPFIGSKTEEVTKAEILKQLNSDKDVEIEERDFENFFEHLTKFQYWYEAEETERAKKFRKLKKMMEENLRELKVFRIGKIQIDIYVVGLDAENRLIGIKTMAVET